MATSASPTRVTGIDFAADFEMGGMLGCRSPNLAHRIIPCCAEQLARLGNEADIGFGWSRKDLGSQPQNGDVATLL
jgi:hypothetical protein